MVKFFVCFRSKVFAEGQGLNNPFGATGLSFNLRQLQGVSTDGML